MFVLYREGYEIYGVGETKEEARQDAVAWLDGGREEADSAELIDRDGGVIGKLYIGRCTERLAAAVRGDLEDLVFDWNEAGMLDVVEDEDVEA